MRTALFVEQPPSRTEVEHWDWEPGASPWPDWGRALARLLGRKEPTGSVTLGWIDWIRAEDRSRIRQLTKNWISSLGNAPLLLNFRVGEQAQETIHVVIQGTITERNADGTARRLIGAVVNTTRQVRAQQELKAANERLNLVIAGISAGVWELNLETGLAQCSPRFYELLGYPPEARTLANQTFLNDLLHPEDRAAAEQAMEQHLRLDVPYCMEVRILTQSGGYRWFEASGQCSRDAQGVPVRVVGSIIDIDPKKTAQLELEKREYVLREVGTMARVGAWEVDLATMMPWWSDEVRRIHEAEPGYLPDLEEAIQFYAEEFRPTVYHMVEACIQEKQPWDHELQIITARNRRIWIRTIGKPMLNEQGQMVGIRGIFQDIDQQKKRELSLQQSLQLIRDQNARLYNFAHIVSHNLRSHTGNLELMVELMQETSSEPEKAEVLERIRAISGHLNETIAHLNEVVTLRASPNEHREKVRFSHLLAETLAAFGAELRASQADVRTDFSAVDEICSVPGYLSGILTNLVSNAIRYRHPERPLRLHLSSERERGHVRLRVCDNGLGIDLDQYGGKLFGLYNTFHRHPEARGFGLFLTRNYVEALGGRIEASSTPGQGTTFTVTF